MCKNEHYYCSSCIKKHLENSAFCPTCLEHLSVDTLKEASRIVKNYLSELNIRCDFYARGCPEMVQLGDLKRHVRSCGFLPVQCSNDGCNILVNARDKLHHEAEVCNFRKLKCHDCGQLKNDVEEMVARQDRMRNEMKEMIEKEMTGMKNEMKGIKNEIKEMKDEIKEMKNEVKNVGEEVKEMIVQVRQDEMRKRISDEVKEEVKNEVKCVKVEIKNEIKEMKDEMKEMIMNAMRDAMTGIKSVEVEMKNSNQSSQATCSSDEKENILVVGGQHKVGWETVNNTTTECFNFADKTWSLLNSVVLEGRSSYCSFLYQGQMIVAGGYNNHGYTNTLKCLDVSDPAATWKDFAGNLPVKCGGHKVVNHNDLLYMSGGWIQPADRGRSTFSDVVHEVQLVTAPYSSKILTRLPQPRFCHGMEMFDQKLFILGGYDGKKITTSVIQYDLVEDKCKEMPPLPYAVQSMATVVWQNNVLLIGGYNERCSALNKVVRYDVITGRSHYLPCMKQKRCGCTAVLTGNVVVVMGGGGGMRRARL